MTATGRSSGRGERAAGDASGLRRAVVRSVAAVVAALACSAATVCADSPDESRLATDPAAMVREMVALGPRIPDTPAHDTARRFLVASLSGLGASSVEVMTMPTGVENIQGVLPGRDAAAGEIVLAAHYDTVAESVGAADNAAGCAVVLAALAEIERAPLRRSLRVIFFDGEEAGPLGSEGWVESTGPADRDRILASIHLDVVGLDREGSPVILDLSGTGRDTGPQRAPAWLVHAALKAGDAVGFPFRLDDHIAPLRAQILARTARLPWSSDGVVLLEAGIPSIVLTDFSALHPYDAMHTAEDVPERLDPARLVRWATVTAALVRRIDALEGRPRWEEEYLVIAGRVFIRRDLLWIGFVLWIVLVMRVRPGRWAGAGGGERRARGRSYLPGYAFRIAFLLAAIVTPAIAAPLLYPLAPLALITPRSTAARVAIAGLATLPTAVWLGLLALAGWLGLASSFALAPAKLALVVATLATFGWQLWTRSARRVGENGARLPGAASAPDPPTA